MKLIMIHNHIDQCPYYELSTAYRIRAFRTSDIEVWAKIEYEAGEFLTEDEAENRFKDEFSERLDEVEQACFILETKEGQPIGTAMAWHGDWQGTTIGRVHWVAIVPTYQGRGLAKPLLSHVMEHLKTKFSVAYLTTQSRSYAAIKLYEHFGFVLYPYSQTCDEDWAHVRSLDAK